MNCRLENWNDMRPIAGQRYNYTARIETRLAPTRKGNQTEIHQARHNLDKKGLTTEKPVTPPASLFSLTLYVPQVL